MPWLTCCYLLLYKYLLWLYCPIVHTYKCIHQQASAEESRAKGDYWNQEILLKGHWSMASWHSSKQFFILVGVVTEAAQEGQQIKTKWHTTEHYAQATFHKHKWDSSKSHPCAKRSGKGNLAKSKQQQWGMGIDCIPISDMACGCYWVSRQGSQACHATAACRVHR